METVDVIIPAYRPGKEFEKLIGFSFHTELSSGKKFLL